MALYLFPLGMIQFFDDSGAPLNGGKLHSYQAGTTTPLATYHDVAGNTAHANPIVLDADGRPPAPIWLQADTRYKFVLKDSTDVELDQWDDVFGVQEGAAASEWAAGATPTFVDASNFTQQGDTTAVMHVNRRVKLTDASTLYGYISAASYSAGTNKTTVTVVRDSGDLSSSLTAVEYAFLAATNDSVPNLAVAVIPESSSTPGTPAAARITRFALAKGASTGVFGVDDQGLVAGLDAGFEVLAGGSAHALDKEAAGINAITPTATRIITLPTTGVRGGRIVRIINLASAQKVTIKSSDGTQLASFQDGHVTMMATQDTPTGSAHWIIIDRSGGGAPRFRAERTAVQNNITGVDKVEYNIALFDNNGDYDEVTNFRFTPTVPGVYQIAARMGWSSLTSGDLISIWVYKNGSNEEFSSLNVESTSGEEEMAVSALLEANGTTDYFEIFASNTGRDTSDVRAGGSVNLFGASWHGN